MNSWQLAKIIAYVLLGVFLAATTHAQESRKVRVGIPTLSPIIAATLVPRDRGYFKQEGLDVETIVIRSAPSVLALAAKEIDFLMTGGGKKVTILAVGSGTERYVALKANIVDAAVLSSPVTLTAKQEGYRELFSFFTDKEYADIPVATFTREDMLQSNGSLVERFVRAQVKGLLYMRANRDGAAGALARALKSKESETGPAFDEIRPTMTDDGTITLEEQRKALEYLLTPAQQKEPPRLERIYDFALARKAFQELQARGWKPE